MRRLHEIREHDCPAPERLKQVAGGTAGTDEEEAIARHLDDCDECQRRYEAFLSPPARLADVTGDDLERAQADRDEIEARPRPVTPAFTANDAGIELACGLRLGCPREAGYLATAGDFDVIAILGEGGMGVVLKAFDRSLHREVALKFISPRKHHDPMARRRFLDEARAAARLNHRSIVTVHSVGEHGDWPYLVMEYVAGESLAHRLARSGKLEIGEAVRIACQVLDALEHAHGAGIIHRDVKPANIVLDARTGCVKLTDFGLARSVANVERLTLDGMVVGTPWYMAPEQADTDHKPDARQDLFSVGVVLYEVLVGALPFPGRKPFEVLASIRQDEPPDPLELNPALPRPLAAIVLRALEKAPARRFASAVEFREALEAFGASDTPEVPPTFAWVPTATAVQPGDFMSPCASCGRTFVKSQTGLGGRCVDCGDVLCDRCWTVAGIRTCRKHTAGEAKPAADTVRQSAQPAVPLPRLLAAGRDERGDRLPAAVVRARAEGRVAVTADEAVVAEESFLRLVQNALETVESVPDPRLGGNVAVGKDLIAGLRPDAEPTPERKAGPGRMGRASPRGAVRVFDVCRRGWFGRVEGRIVFEIRCLVHPERYANDGFDDRPISRLELETLLNDVVRRARQEDAWHMLVVGSLTGWSDSARSFALNAGPKPFQDPLVSVVLYDDPTGAFLLGETDERLGPFRQAFAGEVSGETLERARHFLAGHFVRNQAVALDTIVEALGMSRPAGLRAMKLLADAGHHHLTMVDDLGPVLTLKA